MRDFAASRIRFSAPPNDSLRPGTVFSRKSRSFDMSKENMPPSPTLNVSFATSFHVFPVSSGIFFTSSISRFASAAARSNSDFCDGERSRCFAASSGDP